MHAYGINPNVCAWVEDFLTNRCQRVTVNNCMSDWLPCTSGVPQGSVLGPTLFNLYINDLPDCIHHSDILLYADDAKVFKQIECRLHCVLFQQDIDSIANWCALWQLTLNVSKCVFVRFGLVDRPSCDYYISGVRLQKSVSTKDLGVVFDSKLSFSEQCHTVANKGFTRVNMLLRCFHSRDRDLQIRLFNAFVRPILEYGSPIWSPHLKQDITVIERVQKHFTKCLRGLSNLTYAERLSKLNQSSLQMRRIRTDLIFLYKILHGLVDTDLKRLFILASDVAVCDRTLRGHAYKLNLPKPRTDMLKYSYVYRVVRYWNSLPAAVCEVASLSVFKQRLSDHFNTPGFTLTVF
jgi:ribonucleases P/MRP protein subunit RPP40